MAEAWRRLNAEQRVAGIAAVLLIVSTFGPFSFVEARDGAHRAGRPDPAQAARRPAVSSTFRSATARVILAAGLWAGLLIVVRLFDRPLGQSVLALACAALLAAAGLRERAKRPMDDLPPPPVRPPPAAPAEAATERIPADEAATTRLPAEPRREGRDD